MSTAEALAQSVKAAISGQTANSSTVTTLQSLLSSAPGGGKPATTSQGSRTASSRNLKPAQTAKPVSKTAKKDQPFKVLEDETRALPGKSRYALATEVVNTTLRILADATKQPQKKQPRRSSVSTPRRQSIAPSLSQRALQLRSGNETPSRQSPTKQPGPSRRTSQCSVSCATFSSDHLVPTAECARLSFSYLRSVDLKALGVRELPKLQLENGMLSLCSKLIGLGLHTLAAKELRAVKKMLESVLPGRKTPKSANQPRSELETLPRLLQLDVDTEACQEAWNCLINYQIYVLQVIAAAQKPQAIEELIKFLETSDLGQPATLILRQVQQVGGRSKAAKQLAMLSRTLLQMCPNIASSTDALARDRSQSPSPFTVFKLQALSLRLRHESARLSGQDENLKGLLEPFSKCLAALIRRTPAATISKEIFEACKTRYEALDVTTRSACGNEKFLFVILRALSVLAAHASLAEEAQCLSEQAINHCQNLGHDHARVVAALTRRCSIALKASTPRACTDDLCTSMSNICGSLRKTLSGDVADYEMLFEELATFVTTFRRVFESEPLETAYEKFVGCAAGFASSYVRSCPDKDVNLPQEIIQIALSRCGSNERLLGWINRDVANVFMRSGVLRRVAEKLSSKPMAAVWSSFSSAMTFSRILKLNVLKAVRSDASSCVKAIVDDEALCADERGALLEWQLKHTLEYAHRSKHRASLQALLLEYFRRLATVYNAEDFPLRRARVVIQAQCVREQHPDLLSVDAVATLVNLNPRIDRDILSNDQGLVTFASSIQASLKLAELFLSGNPAVKDLQQCLLSLESICNHAEGSKSLNDTFDNLDLIRAQLASVYDYLDMLDEPVTKLQASDLLYILDDADQAGGRGHWDGALKQSRAYIELGLAEKGLEVLARSRHVYHDDEGPSIERLDYLVCRAECSLATNDLASCQHALELAAQIREKLQSCDARSLHSSQYRLLLGRAWLTASRWMLAERSMHTSLSAAKRSVKVLNSIWSSLERSGQPSNAQSTVCRAEEEYTPVDQVTSGISKLNLKPKADNTSQVESEQKGATFWPVAGLLCRALMHLADVYVYHGVFNEANYASEQAVKFAEAIGSSHLLSRAQCHRSTLLTAAGRLEDAELCLAQDPNEDKAVPLLIRVQFFQAKAALSVKHGDLVSAQRCYDQAEATIKEAQSEAYLAFLEPRCQSSTGSGNSKIGKPRQITSEVSKKTIATTQRPQKSSTGKPVPVRTAAPKPPRPIAPSSEARTSKFTMLEQLHSTVMLEKAIVDSSLGVSGENLRKRLHALTSSATPSFKLSQLEYLSAMQQANTELQRDFSFNVLPESTLSYPTLQVAERRLSSLDFKATSLSNAAPITKTTKRGKSTKSATVPANRLTEMLSAARRCIAPESTSCVPIGTVGIHQQYSLLANASMMLSATSASQASELLHPVSEAFIIDYGRLHASECYSSVAKLDKDSHGNSDALSWPAYTSPHPLLVTRATTFRDDYIRSLPKPWTAVSMTLDEACEELYVTRYRRDQSPLIVRLPLSRGKSDEADEEPFDFEAGREELKEIIDLSNYSCHYSIDTKAKGAKTNWWNEREALDRRLQELLINIENIWLGGFKGVLSQHQGDDYQLQRFRKSFEAIMDRHLPSRKSLKKGAKKLTLDDHILELFIGLGTDQNEEVDLDEPLADLLYFIVDILQFNGERNAYDEIDFDSMAIDVMDALHTYYDSIDETSEQHAHLILILDKRLQAFPWENLPCLERCSVSRVDSMLTLRDRLAQMKQQADYEDGQYKVSNRSGSYILNPSSDLKGTETMLGPVLSKLAAKTEVDWSSSVGTPPSEEYFRNNLSTSSMFLYFGHGAGSQYIGQRAIRRLDKCSDVVWLMGCSSGAVTEYGDLEPVAVPLAYLVAGQKDEDAEQQNRSKCMAVVSTLWDVTDKDIDRFSLALGEEWGLWRSEEESTKLPPKTPRKRERPAAPSTPDKPAKTPKTPKAKKTPAITRTPARSQSQSRARNDEDKKQSLTEAVAKSRDACYLRYLNGAAVVVYGVPVYLGD